MPTGAEPTGAEPTGAARAGNAPQDQASAPSPAAAPSPRLKIVTTFAPIYCFTKNVAGDLADVDLVLAEGPRHLRVDLDEERHLADQ